MSLSFEAVLGVLTSKTIATLGVLEGGAKRKTVGGIALNA